MNIQKINPISTFLILFLAISLWLNYLQNKQIEKLIEEIQETEVAQQLLNSYLNEEFKTDSILTLNNDTVKE